MLNKRKILLYISLLLFIAVYMYIRLGDKNVTLYIDGTKYNVTTDYILVNNLVESRVDSEYSVYSPTIFINENDSIYVTTKDKENDEEVIDTSFSKSYYDTVVIEEYSTIYEKNSKLKKDVQNVKQTGINGVTIETKDASDSSVVHTIVLSTVVNEVIEIGTKEEKTSNVWELLANCESTSRWDLNSGNGYYGGLQFSKATWDKYKHLANVSAIYPHEATKEEQISVATILVEHTSFKQFGKCASKLNLIN